MITGQRVLLWLFWALHKTFLHALKYWHSASMHYILIFKVPSINVNIFTSVQSIHFHGGGEGVCEYQHVFLDTFSFLAWFLLFSFGFLALKKCWCVLFFLGGGLRKCMVCALWKCWHLWMVPKHMPLLIRITALWGTLPYTEWHGSGGWLDFFYLSLEIINIYPNDPKAKIQLHVLPNPTVYPFQRKVTLCCQVF